MKPQRRPKALQRLQAAGVRGISSGTVCTLPEAALERVWASNAHLREWAENQGTKTGRRVLKRSLT